MLEDFPRRAPLLDAKRAGISAGERESHSNRLVVTPDWRSLSPPPSFLFRPDTEAKYNGH